MSDEMRVTVRRRIAGVAPATVFAIVTDPAKHVEIDGSGMLVTAPDATPVTAVGDAFIMAMDREPLGDIPLGKYTVQNTVTQFETDRLLEWAPGAKDAPPFGHHYGYILSVDGDATEVEHYVDWSGVPENIRAMATWPIVPVHMLEKSMDRLVELARQS